MYFAVGDGQALSSQQKQDLGLTMAHIISSLLQNSKVEENGENHKTIQV